MRGNRTRETFDPHRVRPWFSGKLPFAPPVVALDDTRFLLTGAYIDYIDGQAAAALSYKRRQHLITLFIRPFAKQTKWLVVTPSRFLLLFQAIIVHNRTNGK